MKTADLNRRRVLEQTGRTVEFERIDFEFVTDDILMVLVYVDLSRQEQQATAWQLAHVVDVIAAAFDRWNPPSFMSFVHTFSAAWQQLNCRPVRKRKEAAALDNLLPFLEGSEEPPGA